MRAREGATDIPEGYERARGTEGHEQGKARDEALPKLWPWQSRPDEVLSASAVVGRAGMGIWENFITTIPFFLLFFAC
jgi:hypothetical protein